MGARVAQARRGVRACAASVVCAVGGAPPAMMSRASLIWFPSPGLAHVGGRLVVVVGAPRMSPSAF
ncbi:hypothetical protein CO709_10700 [Burkholderia thailandensis]|nr:hypothetical protein CO709_10700 [Burkholderia thailandensis]